MADTPTLVRFKSGWERDGTGSDGLPLYKANIIIVMSRPPWLGIERVATDEDIQANPIPFGLFQKEQAARGQSYSEGYPLALWPACNEAEFKMLTDRDITTVEQLAKLARGKRDAPTNMPAELQLLADRAKKLMELQKGAAKFEDLLKDRDGRIEALEEQLKDAVVTIASQKSIIGTLQARNAG